MRTFIYKETGKDSAIVKKYEDDTLGFNSFPNVQLLDSIKPSKGFTKWELNNASTHKNIYRAPQPKEPLSDTIVLSKLPKGSTGFIEFLIPGGPYTLYISAPKRKKIVTINNLKSLSKFLGTVENKFNAFLWLSFQASTSNLRDAKYKLVKDSFLITFPVPDVDDEVFAHPPSETDLFDTYFVGFDKRIVKIKTKAIVAYFHYKERKSLTIIVDSILEYKFLKNADIKSKNQHKSYVYPSFGKGDIKVFRRYLERMIDYPEILVDENDTIEHGGQVSVRFIIESYGGIDNISIIDSASVLKKIDLLLSSDEYLKGKLDEQLMQLIKKMPPWQPGNLNGRNVPVQITEKIMCKTLTD